MNCRRTNGHFAHAARNANTNAQWISEMTIDPHELINLPGYGNAEKQLRKHGKWRLDPIDEIENAIGDLEVAIDMAQNAKYEIEKKWRMLNK
jgi:hypothetical protein